MQKRLLIAAVAAASVATARAQTPNTPTFDVAAIKQNKSGENGGRFGGPPTRWTATNVPTLQFILYAYEVQGFQVEGAPDWVKNDRYDINGKSDRTFPPAAPGAPDLRRPMLRALLEDRFKLAVHHATREMPIYALVTARADKSLGSQLHQSSTDCVSLIVAGNRGQAPASPPLTPAGDPDCGIRALPGKITFGTMAMAQYAAMLSSLLQRVVVDRTGLAGNYSASITYTPDTRPPGGGPDLPAADLNGASLFTALQEQLGLRLEPSRGPVDVLVIDHIERPTED
jgi:uncharacterized protein (TIGR03435 family)